MPLTPGSKNVGMLRTATNTTKYCMMTNIIEVEESDTPKELIDIWQRESHIVTPLSLPVKDKNVRTTKSVPDTAKRMAEYKVLI